MDFLNYPRIGSVAWPVMQAYAYVFFFGHTPDFPFFPGIPGIPDFVNDGVRHS